MKENWNSGSNRVESDESDRIIIVCRKTHYNAVRMQWWKCKIQRKTASLNNLNKHGNNNHDVFTTVTAIQQVYQVPDYYQPTVHARNNAPTPVCTMAAQGRIVVFAVLTLMACGLRDHFTSYPVDSIGPRQQSSRSVTVDHRSECVSNGRIMRHNVVIKI